MAFCSVCGTELVLKELKDEGMVPYCEKCKAFKFPTFNTAVIVIVFNPSKDKILLLQQYGNTFNILLAGYVNKGEKLEHTVIREVKEEVSLNVKALRYMKSEYFEKSNSLMCNFICVVDSDELHRKEDEVDRAQWYSLEDAPKAIKQGSLAAKFLDNALNNMDIIKSL